MEMVSAGPGPVCSQDEGLALALALAESGLLAVRSRICSWSPLGLLGTSVPAEFRVGAGPAAGLNVLFPSLSGRLRVQPQLSPDVVVIQGGSSEDSRDSVSGLCLRDLWGP